MELRDPEGVLIAVLEVGDVWRPDRLHEARRIFGDADERHPGVFHLLHRTGPVYVGGRLYGIEPPTHYDFPQLRGSPRELRASFAKLGWQRVVAFQTRNPMHRAHQELTLRAVQQAEANLLIHPTVGLTKPGDIDHYSRVRCYEHLLKTYPEPTTALYLLNLAMRMAGRARRYGMPSSARTTDAAISSSAATTPVPAGSVWARLLRTLRRPAIDCPPSGRTGYSDAGISGNGLRAGARPVRAGGRLTHWRDDVDPFRHRIPPSLAGRAGHPEWFSYPKWWRSCAVPIHPRRQRGFTVFFTGLSGSGKSTIANALMVKLLELGGRAVTLLDGDIVRKHLSSELGFSREHRNINILRIGFVASEITKNGGIAICAPIAPYTITRREVREDDRAARWIHRGPRRHPAGDLRGP